MTSGVLVCIKNKTAAFLKKNPHFTFTEIFSVCLESFRRIMLKLSKRHTFFACSLPLMCWQPGERMTGEVGP